MPEALTSKPLYPADPVESDVTVPNPAAPDRATVSAIQALGTGEADDALRFKPLPGGSYIVEKSGIHHFGCTPDSGMHHEDDCPRGLKAGFSVADGGTPVPISFDAGPESGIVVHSGDMKTIYGDPPTHVAGVFFTEGN